MNAEQKEFYRCPDCKHTFEEPEDDEGRTPLPYENVICPNCKHDWLALYYIKLQGTCVGDAHG